MTARSLMGYGNSYYMNWVSNRVVTDIRNQLFAKIVGQSMDFFNRMRAGMLMSRITNDTSAMQAALSQVSGDAFKQPVSIVLVVAVLLYMDWKFTLRSEEHTSELQSRGHLVCRLLLEKKKTRRRRSGRLAPHRSG